MKNFIIIAGLIIYLMFFPVQYVLNQQNHHDMMVAGEIVQKYAQTARTSGYFTVQLINGMRDELVSKLRLDPSEITINVTTVPKYRLDAFDEREMISYQVDIPIKRIMALNQLMGVPESENHMIYTIKGEVASEVPMP